MAEDQDNKNKDALIQMMVYRMGRVLGRVPTEDEVFNYIYGDEATRERIIPGSKLIKGKVGNDG